MVDLYEWILLGREKNGNSAKHTASKRKLSYGVANRAMLMVFVAIMVEMLLTLIPNMSTIYKFTTQNWFIRKFIIVCRGFFPIFIFFYMMIMVCTCEKGDAQTRCRSSLLKFKWMYVYVCICMFMALENVLVHQGVLDFRVLFSGGADKYAAIHKW